MDDVDFCFCTLAVGLEYRLAALFLHKDIENYNPGKKLVVLTDDTQFFEGRQNLIAIRFSSDSMFGCYHDKRFVVAQALARFESCYYLDADCRLIEAAPKMVARKGRIQAWNVLGLMEHFDKEKKYELNRGVLRFNSCERRLKLMRNVAFSLGVDLERAKFMSEVCMAFSRDGIKYKEFLFYWHKTARRLQRRGYSWAEGESIGLVASKIGWDVEAMDCSPWLFKDNLSSSKADRVGRCRQDRSIIASLKFRPRGPSRFLNLAFEIMRHIIDRNKKYLSEMVS